jgi:hypothetical protein
MTWKTRMFALAMAVATLAALAMASGADWWDRGGW